MEFLSSSSSGRRGNYGFANKKSKSDGCNFCGICQICTCLRWSFLKSPIAIVKSVLTATSLFCHFLCLNYGAKYSSDLGFCFSALVSASSASAVTSFVLLAVYMASEDTISKIRPSLFEICFSATCSTLYLLSSSNLVYSVHQSLFFFYHTISNFHAYPAMVAAYVCGFFCGIVHIVDVVMVLRLRRRLKTTRSIRTISRRIIL